MLRPEDVRRHAEMLGNRAKKNHRVLAKRMEAKAIGAYRLYDRDIPEVRAVVDWYEGHLMVAEYAREQTAVVPGYLDALGDGVARAMGVPRDRVHGRDRWARAKAEVEGPRVEVREYGMRFEVTLGDDLDTGLGADHRETRQRVRAEAAGRRVLNLYGGTGAFTVAAALGGAPSSDTVDLSGKGLTRTRKNLSLNGVDRAEHRTVRADVRRFLAESRTKRRVWDLAVLDAPSFVAATPSGDGDEMDLARDHRALLEETLRVLAPGAVLYFSAHHQRFAPELDGLRVRACEEITAETVPDDYRNKTVHRCWRILV
jgi:23S rRNA (cytosine1962-C5)-methyltransferase